MITSDFTFGELMAKDNYTKYVKDGIIKGKKYFVSHEPFVKSFAVLAEDGWTYYLNEDEINKIFYSTSELRDLLIEKILI